MSYTIECRICGARGETEDSIQHGVGSKKCPGGPNVKLYYIDAKGNASATKPTSSKKKQSSTSTGE